MEITELAVLDALNMLQRHAPGEPGVWQPVTCADVTTWLRQEAGNHTFMEGFRWKPTKGQVNWVLMRLSGRMTKVGITKRIKDPLIEVIEGEPNRYRLAPPGVKVLCA